MSRAGRTGRAAARRVAAGVGARSRRSLAAALVAGCAAPRIVPVPAAGVQVDAAQGDGERRGGGRRALRATVGLAREPLGPR